MLQHPDIQALKQKLREHSLYAHLDSAEALRVFMSYHVFCTWDFMSLIKSLQRQLTCVSIPWMPPTNMALARFVNEIILDEETDWVDEKAISHFELYYQAMREVGCEMSPIDSFIQEIQTGQAVESALKKAKLPMGIQHFVKTTFEIIQQPLEIQAAVFFHGREDIIPSMFVEIVKKLESSGLSCRLFLLYLERHIALDGEEHGPRAEKLLASLLSNKQDLLPEIEVAVITALNARLQLWDEILHNVKQPVKAC